MIFLFLAYIVFLIIYSVYSYFALYHLKEFGHEGDSSKIVNVIYITISVAIVGLTMILFVGTVI